MGKINELDVTMDNTVPVEPGFYPLKGVNPKIVSNPNLTHWEPFPADPSNVYHKKATKAAPKKPSGPYPDDEFRKSQTRKVLQKYVLEEDDHIRHVARFRIAQAGKPYEDQPSTMERAQVHEDMLAKVGISPADLAQSQDELERLVGKYTKRLKAASNRYAAAFVLLPIVPVSLPLKLRSDAMFEEAVPILVTIIKTMREELTKISLSQPGVVLECGLNQKHFDRVFRQPEEQMVGVGHHFYYQLIDIQLVVPESLVDGYVPPATMVLSSVPSKVAEADVSSESEPAEEMTMATETEEKVEEEETGLADVAGLFDEQKEAVKSDTLIVEEAEAKVEEEAEPVAE